MSTTTRQRGRSAARPERLRVLVLDIVGKLVRQARQILPRGARAFAPLLLDRFRFTLPALAGE